MNMNITILGHVCIDKNTSENASYTAAGSPAMFMNKIYKQFPNADVTIIAPYGKDFLRYKGNTHIYPDSPNNETTLIYENISKAGSRQQKAHNRNEALPVPIDEKSKQIIAASDIVFIAPLMPNFSADYLRQLLASAKQGTLTILLPQGYYRDFDDEDNVLVRPFIEADDILPLVDVVIVSEQDHADMLSLAQQWAKKYNLITIVTEGEKGAVAITKDNKVMLPARMVQESEIVDSVGSGDIFSAGFSYRYKQTSDLEEAGRFANELARQCLFFTPDEIIIDYEALLKT